MFLYVKIRKIKLTSKNEKKNENLSTRHKFYFDLIPKGIWFQEFLVLEVWAMGGGGKSYKFRVWVGYPVNKCLYMYM